MISDVLHETVDELDHYLNCPTFADCYKGKLREQIVRLRDEALYIARVLDTPPGAPVPGTKKTLAAIAAERRQAVPAVG